MAIEFLVGSSAGQSGASANLRVANKWLKGSLAAQSGASGKLTVKRSQIFSKYTPVPGLADAKLDNSNIKYAQTLPVYYRHWIYKLELRLRRTNNPGTLHIEVRENDPNTQEYYPTGDLIAWTDFDTSDIDSELEWVTIYLDHPGLLEELLGMYNPKENNEERIPRIYGIILSCSGADATNYIEWRYGNTEPMLDYGRYCYYDGAEWSNNFALDFLFIEYGYRTDLSGTILPALPQMIHPALTCSITIQNYEPKAPFIGGEYKTTIIGNTTYDSNFPFSLFEIEYVGLVVKRYLDDFYYRIHIYENPINLDLILTDLEQEFWVWNAFFVPKILEDITILSGALNLVGQTAPHTFQNLEAQKYIAEITKEGVPDYRAEVSFEFKDPIEKIILVITGTRAIVLFWRPESKIREMLEGRTTILKAHGGKEQRIKLRQALRQFFRLRFIFDTNKTSTQFDSMLHRWQKRPWIIPIWTEYAVHSDALLEDAESIAIDTRYADFRAGSYAMIWKSTLEYETVLIDSVDVDKLNLGAGIVNSYIGNQYVLPLRVGYMVSKNIKRQYNSPASMIEALFAISDNIDITGYISERTLEFGEADLANIGNGDVSNVVSAEGIPTEIWELICTTPGGAPAGRFSVKGSISGEMIEAIVGSPYDNGKIAFKINAGTTDYVVGDNFQILEVLTTPSYMAETHQEESDGQIEINDFETGIFKVRSDKEFNLLTQNHIFYNDTKKTSWELRQFLHWLNGRQRAVLIPTYRDDLTLKENIGSTDKYFYIENIKLAINMGANELRTYIGFYFPDKTLLIRKITAITEIDETKEKIDINASLGKTVNLGDCEICFVDKCRLASDRVEINWPFAHRSECRPNLIRVP